MLKKDYCQKKQLKPEYRVRAEQRAEKRKSFVKKMILFFSILILIISIVYLLFFSSIFKIKKITITGLSKVGDLNLAENIVRDSFQLKRFGFFSNQNAFVINKAYLSNTLKRQLAIESVKLEIILPKTIKINIVKNETALIWQAGEKYFSILKDGVANLEIADLKNYELPVVRYNTTTELIIGEKYLTAEQINYIKKIFALFIFYFKNEKVSFFELASVESRELKIFTESDWHVLFSLDLDPEESLKLASRVWEEKLKHVSGLQYIDVRIRDRIYYK